MKTFLTNGIYDKVGIILKICDSNLNWFWLQIVTLGNSTLGTYFTATSTLVLRW